MKKNTAIVLYGLKTGGAELQFLELANWLNITSNLHVYAFAKRGSLDKEFEKFGIKLTILDYQSKLGLVKAMYRFYKEIKVHKPTTIISTSLIGNSMTLLSKFFLHVPQIISFQTVAKCMSRFEKIDRYVLNHFDCIVAGANKIADYLKEHQINDTEIHVIHNWVDFESKIPTQTKEETFKQFNLDITYVNVGCVARLHEQKGQIYLLEAFSLLNEYPLIRLYLVGDGPEKENLQKIVMRLGLSSKVFFLGEQRDGNYLNLLNNFDLLVMPSLYEGLPRTLLDAMFFKKAIIATNVDGNVEAIENYVSGLLVDAKSSEQLADAILKLVDDKELRISIGKNAFKKVQESFDMKKQFKKITNLFK